MGAFRRAVIYRAAEVSLILLMVFAVFGVFGPLVYATARPEDAQAQAVSRLWQGAVQMLWAGVACMMLPLAGGLFVAARVREWAAARITRINYDIERALIRSVAEEFFQADDDRNNFPWRDDGGEDE